MSDEHNSALEEDRLCALVMIDVRPDGTKESIAIEDGYRESTESWATVLRGFERRGMRAPVLAVGDGALGFWKAFKLLAMAGQRWRRINGAHLIPLERAEETFTDGARAERKSAA